MLDVSRHIPFISDSVAERVHSTADGFGELVFKTKDIQMLGLNSHLNDTCVNGCTTLLHLHYSSPHTARVAIFSTHDLPHV